MRASLCATSCAAALLAVPTAALAQAKTDPQLEEIVVTATRRSERLQDVPLSITAFSQEDLTTKGIVGYEGLARETPGVVLNRATANFNNFTARGIATNGYGANLQSTVAIYHRRAAHLDHRQHDRAGSESLRRRAHRVPARSAGHAVRLGLACPAPMRILTKSPDLTSFDASALVDYGLTVGRFAAPALQRDGQRAARRRQTGAARRRLLSRTRRAISTTSAPAIDNSNTLVDWGGRAMLLWRPTEPLSVRLLFSHEDSNPEDSSLTNAVARAQQARLGPSRPVRRQAHQLQRHDRISVRRCAPSPARRPTPSSTRSSSSISPARSAAAIAFGLDAYGYQDTFVEEARLASDPGRQGRLGDRRLLPRPAPRRGLLLPLVARVSSPPTTSPVCRTSTTSGSTTTSISHEIAGFGELTYHFTDRFWLTGGVRYGSLDAQAYHRRRLQQRLSPLRANRTLRSRWRSCRSPRQSASRPRAAVRRTR